MLLIDSPPGDRAADIETDICVIGAGPAGIAFTRELIGLPIRVSVIESGSSSTDRHVQALSRSTTDSPYHPASALADGRRRQVGGTSNLWVYRIGPGDGRRQARSLPPESIDFESREDRPETGWPFSTEALRPYYARAQSVWNGGPADYSVDRWSSESAVPLAFPDGLLTTRISQHGPNDAFAIRYRDDLLVAENVTLHLGCTAVELESDAPSAAIRRARVARNDGSAFAVAAKAFVLAGGGVENVQLMLLSAATRPGGPANLHDNVGRYFTDHPEFRMGTITPTGPDLFERIGLYDIRAVEGIMVSGLLTVTEEAKRRERLLNMSAVLVPQPAGFGTAAHRAIASVLAARRGGISSAMLADLGALVRSPRDAAAVFRLRNRLQYEFIGGWSLPEVDRRAFRTIEVHASTEQTVDRENRVTLGGRRDWLGRRQPHLRWRWSEDDRRNLGRSIALVAASIEDAGIGRFTAWMDLEGKARPISDGLHHPMGGTRMHRDPRYGVVDEHCQVHGTPNLYVAGSSVFPSGHGYANPTLSVLALAIRLADHVTAQMGSA